MVIIRACQARNGGSIPLTRSSEALRADKIKAPVRFWYPASLQKSKIIAILKT